MALAEHRRRRDIALFGLLDGQPHRLLVGDVAKRPNGRRRPCGRRFLDDDPGRAGDDMADLDALDIGRDLDDPVRIVADEIGADDVAHDERGLLRRARGGDKQRPPDLVETFRRDFRHRSLLDPLFGGHHRIEAGELHDLFAPRAIFRATTSSLSRFSIQNSMTLKTGRGAGDGQAQASFAPGPALSRSVGLFDQGHRLS